MTTASDSQREVDPVLGPGSRLGSYLLCEQVGAGSSAVVHRAVRISDGAEVALKLLRPEVAENPVAVSRFRREARIAQGLRHPNLVPVHAIGAVGPVWFLEMDLIGGSTLAEQLAVHGPLGAAALVETAAHLCAALDTLHRAGVVHRDVTPRNVLLMPTEGDGCRAVLTDVGLAQGGTGTAVTRPGDVIGTLDYLAPELIRGRAASPATDLYALGCLLFECATGAPPFAGLGVLRIGRAHLEQQPPDLHTCRPDLPAGLCWMIETALAKDPAGRPPTAIAYAHLMRAAAGGR